MRMFSQPETKKLASSTPVTHDNDVYTILAGQLFDSYARKLVPRQCIKVHKLSGLILDVSTYKDEDYLGLHTNNSLLDLRHLTVLPGFVDVHVHFFLHPYADVSWDDQLTKESLTERVVRATVHAKRTIQAGFTTVRDLGTEGAEDADVALRRCISGPKPLIPGPRYFVANRAIVSTGAYGPRSYIHPNREGIDGVTGAEVADGEVECMKAVRRQISAGADVVKVYADYRFRGRMADVSRATASASIPTFSRPELQVILQTAAQYGTKVAAHSTERPSVSSLLALGVHSIEHAPWESLVAGLEGVKITDASSSTHWVPTLSVMYTTREVDGGKRWAQISKSFQQALAAGFDRIACGGDTGPFPHGENALEMRLMVKLGADWRRVIQWGTLGGWKCVRSMRWEGKEGSDRLTRAEALVDGGEDIRVVGDNEVPFGAIRRGWAADIVAIDGDLEKDFDNAVGVDSVKFVMKGGRIFKSGGVEIPWM